MERIAASFAMMIAVLVLPGPAVGAPPARRVVVKGGSANLVPRRKQALTAEGMGPFTEVELARLSVTGDMDEAVARPIIAALTKKIEACLHRFPPARQRLEVELRVAASGRVNVKVRGSTKKGARFEGCVSHVLVAARFPTRPLPSQLVVVYTFKIGAGRVPVLKRSDGDLTGVFGTKPAATSGKGNTDTKSSAPERHKVGGGLGAIGRGLERGSKEPMTTNGRGSAAIDKVIKRHAAALQRCYEPLRWVQPKATVTIQVKVRIDHRGAVTAAKVLWSTTGDQQLQRCVVADLRTWRFPKPRGGSEEIEFPLTFGPHR